MKVIWRGIKPGDILYKATCSVCTSTLEAKSSELVVQHERNETLRSAECPVCSTKVFNWRKL